VVGGGELSFDERNTRHIATSTLKREFTRVYESSLIPQKLSSNHEVVPYF